MTHRVASTAHSDMVLENLVHVLEVRLGLTTSLYFHLPCVFRSDDHDIEVAIVPFHKTERIVAPRAGLSVAMGIRVRPKISRQVHVFRVDGVEVITRGLVRLVRLVRPFSRTLPRLVWLDID